MTAQENIQQSFLEANLRPFLDRNPHVTAIVENNNLTIDKPWGKDDARLNICINDQDFISDINNIGLNPRYDAIFHYDEEKIEFLYAFLNPAHNKETIDRKFTLHFEGVCYELYFDEPTTRLFKIASTFERLPSDIPYRSVPQIIPFKDYQILDTHEPRVVSYFKDKVPRSFFIKSNGSLGAINLETLFRHINFIMSYYDRHAPSINIHPDEIDEKETKPSIRYTEGSFPPAMLVQPIDDIILKLIEVARESQARFSFLYYYQVFEYAGYYYIDESAKKALRSFLRDPALINCGEERVSDLFAIFGELNHADDVKMKKVISDFCDPSAVWREIENDKEFFSSTQSFNGGFELKPLISKETTEDSWKKMWMPMLYEHLTKIRNSLVHARERRENKVILPTKYNNSLLKHYIPVIARVAEQIALKS